MWYHARVSRLLVLMVVLLAALTAGCAQLEGREGVDEPGYEDGTYRGVFIDRDEIQVNVQFSLQDNHVTDIGFRLLQAQGDEYLHAPEGTTEARLRDEYQRLITYLVGRDIRVHLEDLYHPERIAHDVDGLTAATMRSSKMISAIRDGLNRGPYSR